MGSRWRASRPRGVRGRHGASSLERKRSGGKPPRRPYHRAMGEHERERGQQSTTQEPAQQAAVALGGVAAMKHLLANGPPSPAQVAALVDQYAAETHAIVSLL